MHGLLEPVKTPRNAIPGPRELFLGDAGITLPVGWQAIEIYPFLDVDYWREEYAPAWAELDLLNAIAQGNAAKLEMN